jgi:hypothetical protein
MSEEGKKASAMRTERQTCRVEDLLEQLNLTLPAQPPPRISSRRKLLSKTER